MEEKLRELENNLEKETKDKLAQINEKERDKI
jgi:hypothetical protein